MATAFADIAFTPAVKAAQTRYGSRESAAGFETADRRNNRLGPGEAAFIAGRDSFYQASRGENGWPYVQHRGGARGFLRVLDERTLGYADFRGNGQYISVGNLDADDRVSLILVDYPNRRRLKVWGRARVVDGRDEPALLRRLEDPDYRARAERAVLIEVEAFDWNCPQHIQPRHTEDELAVTLSPLRSELARLRADNAALRGGAAATAAVRWGDGPLALEVTGVRLLTPRVRAYELRAADRSPLPPVAAGAHLALPIRLDDGSELTRRYSIASDPAQRDAWTIAVLREDRGTGGSLAVHARLAPGARLDVAPPSNAFALDDGDAPAVLIAGGIGITPIKAMAHALVAAGRAFELHYTAPDAADMPFAAELERDFGRRARLYHSRVAGGRRLDVEALLARAPAGAHVYACGPGRLLEAVRRAAAALDVPPARLHWERFGAEPGADDRPVAVRLRRSGRTVRVPADRSVLDSLNDAGVRIASECRAGTCGTCFVPVLEGRPDHRDDALDAAARERGMCACVSRALGDDLVLDL